jgi:hypothetical protein
MQIGTEQDYTFAGASYYAWYELLPASSTPVNMTITPGDQMNASIVLDNSTTNQWSITITDLTTGQQFQTSITYMSSQLSAEWIVERPEVAHRLSTLADFGTVTFTNCAATLGSITGTINDFPNAQLVMYQSLINGAGLNQLVSISDLSSDGSSFAASYEATNTEFT